MNMVAFVPTNLDCEESWTAPGDLKALGAQHAGWDDPVLETIGALDQTFRWGIYDRAPLPYFRSTPRMPCPRSDCGQRSNRPASPGTSGRRCATRSLRKHPWVIRVVRHSRRSLECHEIPTLHCSVRLGNAKFHDLATSGFQPPGASLARQRGRVPLRSVNCF